MRTSDLLAAWLAGLVILTGASARAAADANANAVPISITWQEPIAPTGVTLDGDPSGEQQFTPSGKSFTRTNRGTGQWMSHRVSVHFPADFSIPFILRTEADQASLELHAQIWDVSCTPDTIKRIQRVSENKGLSQREIMSAIITARSLSQRDKCIDKYARQVKQLYFKLSCNFSKAVSFFELSPDAMTAYEETKVAGKIEAQSCLTESRGVVVTQVNQKHLAAINTGDWTVAERLEGELLQMASSPEWSAAFHEAAKLTERAIESRALRRRYQQSLEANDKGDFSTALELNRGLQKQLADGTEIGAFRLVSISNQLLLNDAAYFETRQAEAMRQMREVSSEE